MLQRIPAGRRSQISHSVESASPIKRQHVTPASPCRPPFPSPFRATASRQRPPEEGTHRNREVDIAHLHPGDRMHVCVRAHHALHPGRRDLRGRRQSGSSYVPVLLPPERTCRPLAALLGAQLRPCHRTPPAPPVHPSRKATPHVGAARSPRPAPDARALPSRDILPPLPKKRKRVMPLDALCTPEPLPPGSPEDRPQHPSHRFPLHPPASARLFIRATLYDLRPCRTDRSSGKGMPTMNK